MQKMIVFEDLNETYISVNSTGLHESLDAEAIRTPNTQVSKKLAEASLDFQHLSAAFMTDASQFWDVCRPDWVWKQLLTLSLTSCNLVPHKESKDVNGVIYSAALAMKKMPKLEIMVLWNGGKDHAAVFRYKSVKASGYARIVWRGSWSMQFEIRVVTAWQNVARANHSGHLQILNELLTPSQIRSHGEAVLILELETEVACPVSIQQIHNEHQ